MVELELTYYPDITQGVPDDEVRKAVVHFASELAEELSRAHDTAFTMRVLGVLSVPDQFNRVLDGKTHIALMKPVAYVLAHRRDSHIRPACVAHRPIDGQVGTTYYAQIYARADQDIGSLADLAQKGSGELRIAYGDRFSTSNFLIPASMLSKAGIHPFLFFKEARFTGGHDAAAKSVYEGAAEIGAGHDGVIKILSEQYPDASDKLIQIGREDIHSDPVVVHTGVLPDPVTLKSVQNACVAIAQHDSVKEALDLFWGWVKDLSPTVHENYASIENALRELRLGEKDLLR